jgi:ribonuclease H2 subunit B
LSSYDRYPPDITPDLTVYRYSEDKVMEYLQAKVSRLSKHAVAEKSRSIIRGLAKDGLMDDGKEDLLERKCGSSWYNRV